MPGGLAVQILDKNLPQEVIEKIESKLSNFSMTSSLKNNTLEEIVSFVLDAKDLIFEEMNVIFKCNCSREKAYESLKVLDIDDIYELIAEGKAEITCKWCNSVYVLKKMNCKKSSRRRTNKLN